MTSLHTNIAAQSALATLRAIGGQMSHTQQQVSSGLRVATAEDNAAYWSVATTMRSDNLALSAVQDALGLGAAKVDTAYAGMNAVSDILSQFKARVVAAAEEGVDRAKIQEELEQLKQEILTIAQGSSFSGENWLSTNIADMSDPRQATASVVSALIRDSSDRVHVSKVPVDLRQMALFNTTAGGLLQAEPIRTGTFGGLNGGYPIDGYGSSARTSAYFPNPVTFSAGEQVSFDITMDAGDTSDGKTYSVIIDETVVNDALGVSTGQISVGSDLAKVFNKALENALVPAHSSPTSYFRVDPLDNTSPWLDDGAAIRSDDGLPGIESSIRISHLTSTLPGAETLGLYNGQFDQGEVAWGAFGFTEAFELGDAEAISLTLQINTEVSTTVIILKHDINQALGIRTGLVSDAEDLAKVLDYKLGDLGITASANSTVVYLDLEPSAHPALGKHSSFSVTDVQAIAAPTNFGILDVDVTSSYRSVDVLLQGVEYMAEKVASAAAQLGSLQSRIEMQSFFADKLGDSINRGIGRLVDADMDEASTRLKALQTQEQLAVQSLSIANSNSETIMQLFR
ncbi:flagellin N-terminal helical domain-containing protein [Rhizobium halophilum]|uniref:flagellin N-terminal helical domain-containing protein n=1 Tax=Rhizobium halophilum TaxID=2846852 RepID=UPI001EFDFA24|nr:flagellin [Rhizobium halophilum]MCF6367799.1 flagellin [Rhizobium halophilum]